MRFGIIQVGLGARRRAVRGGTFNQCGLYAEVTVFAYFMLNTDKLEPVQVAPDRLFN